MNLVYGTYSPRGDDREYHYDATWRRSFLGLTWSATVYLEDRVALEPEGVMLDGDAANGEALVRGAVREAIKRRISG